MPKSDIWPDGVAMESLSNMDSAGSCDSVISMNSGYSEDSMEYLSAEEKACLMYLEETIEALEVQEDSGLSNDEPDHVLQAENINDISTVKKSDEAEHHALNETSEPQSSPEVNIKDLETSVNLMSHPITEPVTHCEIRPPAIKTGVLCLSKDKDGNLKIASSSSQSIHASEMDVGLIPPPSDFMDEPRTPPQPEKAKDLPPPAGISSSTPRETVDLEQLSQRTSSPVTHKSPNNPPEVSPLAVSSGPQLNPRPESVEPRSPPAVAPKPKKLPPNIILKSHKAAVADGNSGHVGNSGSDRLLLDPQRVRMEALRKLGLIKSEEIDSGPVLSTRLSPKSRRSWAAPSSPISPGTPRTPPTTPSYTRINGPSVASIPLQSPAAVSSSTASAVQLPDIVPAPAAFSDSDGPLLPDNVISGAAVNTPPLTPLALTKQKTPPKAKGAKSATLERSYLGLSGFTGGQDSSEAARGVDDKQSPSLLRKTRPRPASLGSGKAFSSAHGEGSHMGHAIGEEPDLRRSLPAFQHAADSQKLPRSQGVSVLICPRAEYGDDRREALKRLGLLRD